MDIDITGLINPTIAITLWVLGLVIKHVSWRPIKDISNRFIPVLLTIVGIMMSTIMNGDVTFEAMLSGFITAMFAVGVHASGKNLLGQLFDKAVHPSVDTVGVESAGYTGNGFKDIENIVTLNDEEHEEILETDSDMTEHKDSVG